MSKELQIRYSTVDFFVFTRDAGEDGIEVRVQNKTIYEQGKFTFLSFSGCKSLFTNLLNEGFLKG